MAITRERLEELIEKGVEIYSIYESPFDKPCVSYIELDKLFETKAEVEFVAKYKNIERTEYLDLPTWEEAEIDKLVEISNNQNYSWYLIKSFTDKKNNEMFEFSLSKDDDQFYLSVNNEDGSYKDLFCKPLTYENYLQACELCKKLFIGEEV